MSHTLYARYTDEQNKVHINSHQVWDQALFIAARRQDAADLNSKQPDPLLRNASFTVISQDEYKALK